MCRHKLQQRALGLDGISNLIISIENSFIKQILQRTKVFHAKPKGSSPCKTLSDVKLEL